MSAACSDLYANLVGGLTSDGFNFFARQGFETFMHTPIDELPCGIQPDYARKALNAQRMYNQMRDYGHIIVRHSSVSNL